jgi:hypothetical protein
VQEVKALARAQRDLEDIAATAFAKCLYSIFGVELEKGIGEAEWGGASAVKAQRSSLDTTTAVEVFVHVKEELQEMLQGEGARSRLARHRPLLEHLRRSFPRPPPAVRCPHLPATCISARAPTTTLTKHIAIARAICPIHSVHYPAATR